MIHIAWKEQKSVILIGLVLILLTAMQRIFELLVSPMILSAIETKAGIVRLLLTILLFAYLFVYAVVLSRPKARQTERTRHGNAGPNMA